MTLIVGIVCKDAIVLASDMQLTSGNQRIPDSTKITSVAFTDRKALVAEAGMANLSNYTVDLFQREARGRNVPHDDFPAQLLQQTVRRVRNEQTELFPGQHSVEEFKEYFRDVSPYDLTLAYYYDDKPYLYKINLDECIYVKARTHCITSGIGRELGDYLLKEHAPPGMEFMQASHVATFVVETVKQHVEGCGSKTYVGYIQTPRHWAMRAVMGDFPTEQPAAAQYWDDEVTIFSDSFVNQMAASMREIMADLKGAATEKINAKIEALSLQKGKELLAAFEHFARMQEEKYGSSG